MLVVGELCGDLAGLGVLYSRCRIGFRSARRKIANKRIFVSGVLVRISVDDGLDAVGDFLGAC